MIHKLRFFYDGEHFVSTISLRSPQLEEHIDLGEHGIFVVQEVRWITATDEFNIFLDDCTCPHTEERS